jgi:hypothetical protein
MSITYVYNIAYMHRRAVHYTSVCLHCLAALTALIVTVVGCCLQGVCSHRVVRKAAVGGVLGGCCRGDVAQSFMVMITHPILWRPDHPMLLLQKYGGEGTWMQPSLLQSPAKPQPPSASQPPSQYGINRTNAVRVQLLPTSGAV